MTVKCKNGCINKPYDFFEKISDLSNMDEIYDSPYFEDNRSNIK